MHRNSGERHFASCATRDPFIAMDPSIPGALHHIRVCLFHGRRFSLCFSRYFTMHRAHYRKPYDSILAENCRYLNLGTVHCLFYACITCFDNVPESLEFFSYVLTFTAQLVNQRKPYPSVLAENYRHFEISKWCIDDAMLPYVHRQCTCTCGVIFLYVSRTFSRAFIMHLCLLQTLCLFFGWELSPFESWNGAFFILSFAFRVSTMYPNLCIGQCICICTSGVS